MSAHSHPPILLWRMAVYAAALVVLATARLPQQAATPAPPQATLAERLPQAGGDTDGSAAEQRVQARSDSFRPPTAPSVHTSTRPPVHTSTRPPVSRSSPIRLSLAGILLVGVATELRRRREPWR